ncbi:MAG: hypothetical protein F6J93_33585 [Oscillatoria sp. SIO1A7]|nr:hypothetical protein [Oscillatoria sp. SIO1A7]
MNRKLKLRSPESARHLEDAGELFILLDTPAEAFYTSEWIQEHFPIASWGRIDWDKVPNCLCKSWQEDDDLLIHFQDIVKVKKIKGYVTVTWFDASKMSIYLDIKVIFNYAEIIFQECWDTWIFSDRENWCLEVYHEGEICFGYSALTNDRRN